MKALIGSGLCLALACVSARAFAEELQWRPAVGTAGARVPAAGITPVSYTVPVSAPAAAPGIGLGRPVGASGPSSPDADLPDFRANGVSLERPLVRGQAPEAPMQPLPVGFPLKQESGKADAKGSGTGAPPAVKPLADSELMAPMPRVMQGVTIRDSVGSSPAVMDGCGVACPADCGCFNESCGCDECCPYRGRRVYASASYLGWAFQRKEMPPLVTVSPLGTPAASTGVLGVPTTIVLFDRDNQENTYHTGGRFNLGLWMPGGNWALEVDYLILGQQSANAMYGSNGDPQIARPIVIGGNETVQFVAQPGLVNGTVFVHTSSQMWGLEMSGRQKLLCGPCGWVDMLYGYRHLDLSENISIGENLTQLNPAGNLGIGILDQFHTRNVFNGPQVGIQGEWHFWNRFFAGGTFKLAVGDMHEQVNISGLTAFTPLPGGTTTTFNSGILATGSNIGNHQSDRFVVIPEMNLKLGFEINDHWRVWAGYDFLFASNVVRPGDQIDRHLNPSQIPLPPPAGAQPLVGAAQPAVLFRTTTFYAQGVSFGVQYRW